MTLHRRLIEEFETIRRIGDEVAQRHPDLARFVDLESNDPDVRQLLGGLALVAANFRERVREEIPLTSQSLLRVLHPQELRPTPSMTVVEFVPRRGVLGTARTIPRGLEMRSESAVLPASTVGRSTRSGESVEISCGWRTTASVEIAPIELRAARRTPDGRGATLDLEFAAFAGGGVSGVLPRRLRLFVRADTEETRAAVRAALLDPAVLVEASLLGEDGEVVAACAAEGAVDPVGLDTANRVVEEDRTHLLPWPSRCDEGLRLLFELAVFPAKFGFVEVDLDRLGVHRDPDLEIEGLRLRLRGISWPVGADTATVRPFCTVAVNLFECSARRVDLREPPLDLPLTPGVDHPGYAEVFEVVRVSAAADEHLEIPPVDAWLQASREDGMRIRGVEDEHRYMTVRSRRISDDGYAARLRLIGDRRRVPGEALDVRMLCTNGRAPEHLGIHRNGISFTGLPTTVAASCVAPVSPAFPTRGDGDALWRLLGLVGTAGDRRIDRRQLLEELRLAIPLPENHRRSEAIRRSVRGATSVWTDRVVDRAWRRCEEVRIDLDPGELEGDGDFALVADVLDAWARAVGPLNRVHRVVVRDVRSDQSRDYAEDGRIRAGRPGAVAS